jgi:hypothetical protein
VAAYWISEPFRDGRALKAGLHDLLAHLPGPDGLLPPELWSAEALALAICRLLPWCVAVRITRAEGYEVIVWLPDTSNEIDDPSRT